MGALWNRRASQKTLIQLVKAKMQAELEESKSEMSHYLASERGGEVRVNMITGWLGPRAALQAAALQKTMGL